MQSTTYDFDAEYDTKLAAAMNESGAHWIPTDARFHGAPDLMMLQAGIYPGRQILSLPGVTYPWTPETCRDVDNPSKWVLNDLVLVCQGCGINGT